MTTFTQGAKWLRVDFHLHTRADREFHYEGDEGRFVASYVEKLKAAKIQIGVVTNHNKFDLDEFRALRKAARQVGICLLPGVELSVGDGANGIHTLAVFSDDWIAGGHNLIEQFLGNVFAGKSPAQYQTENARSQKGILDTIGILATFEKPFFLVFAHVEQSSGLWEELDGGRLGEIGQNSIFRNYTLGFQKVRTRDRREKVKQWLKDWYPAEVEGSDPKSLEDIGKGSSCFLKLGELSFEAVKFALFDHVERCRSELPTEHQSCRIKSVHFDGAKLNGTSVHWSPALNCLIGPRGNGKSAIIECCRHVLGMPVEDRADSRYKNDLVQSFLTPGGKVILEAIDEFGREIRIERERAGTPSVFVDGAYHEIPPSAVLKDILYFGQKDLSARSESFDESFLDRLLADRVSPNAQEDQRLVLGMQTAAKSLKEAVESSEKVEAFKKEIETLEVQLKVYADKGVDAKLQGMTEFDADRQALHSWQDQVLELGKQLRGYESEWADIVAEFPKTKSKPFETVSGDLLAIQQLVAGAAANNKSATDELAAAFSAVNEALKKLEPTQQRLKDDLAQLQKTLNEPNLDLDLFRKKKSRLDQLRKLITTGSNRVKTVTAARDLLGTSAQALHEARRRGFQAREVEIKRIEKELPEDIRIRTDFKGNKIAFGEFLRTALRGSGIQGPTYDILTSGFEDGWDLYRRREELDNLVSETAALKIKGALSEQLPEFIAQRVPDTTEIVYRGISLGHYSLGQRATVILHILMHVKRYPVIIIDQPEDDLDNETLYSHFVQQLLERKEDTQFIFATHNANIPVLGDAEQVIVCRRQDDEFRFENGSIDARTVQERIITVMEGGREAFKRRKDIYQQWKNSNSEIN